MLSLPGLQLRGNGVIDQLRRRWTEDLDQCTSLDLTVRPSPSILQYSHAALQGRAGPHGLACTASDAVWRARRAGRGQSRSRR